jgi:hypothetical protein
MNAGDPRGSRPADAGRKESTKTSAVISTVNASAMTGSRRPAPLWPTRTIDPSR